MQITMRLRCQPFVRVRQRSIQIGQQEAECQNSTGVADAAPTSQCCCERNGHSLRGLNLASDLNCRWHVKPRRGRPAASGRANMPNRQKDEE